jgi:acyl dehydratase
VRTLEDFSVGDAIKLGSYTLTQQEIVDFASRYDPQPFHVENEHDLTKAMGGLLASGWHTASIYMRLAVDAYMSDTAVLTSPGVDDLQWLQPVRVGDILTGDVAVLSARVSRSKPDRGILETRGVLRNQHEQMVFSVIAKAFVKTRAGLS